MLDWGKAELLGDFAFQPRGLITKHDFEGNQKWIEGDWIGFIGGLEYDDIERLRGANPQPGIQDIIIGPQLLNIWVVEVESSSANPNSNQRISICGKGYGIESDTVNHRHFTVNGELRRVYLHHDIDMKEKQLFWRLIFVQTYVDGDDSGIMWNYDGMYCPGMRSD